jgi:hypothetical protein
MDTQMSSVKPGRRRLTLLASLFAAAVLLGGTMSMLPLRNQGVPTASAQDSSAASGGAAAADGRALDRLWHAVLGLRNKCAVEGASGWNAFVTPEAARQVERIGQQIWAEDADLGWSSFFARALFDIGRPASPAPLVGFYHPWGDAWLLVEWQFQPELKITAVELLSGEWIRRRGVPPFDPRPDWLRRDGYRVEQLARAAVENLRLLPSLAYGKKPWRETLNLEQHRRELDEIHTPAVAVNLLGAMLRADELALGAAAFGKDQTPPPALEQLRASSRRFLASGREGNAGFFVELTESTNPATAAALRKLAPEAYSQLVPAYWLADPDWAEALFVPDHNPDFCLALTYKRNASRLQLTRIDLVHFPSVAAAAVKRGGK